MFKEIKEMLINQVDELCALLEFFGFENINYRAREIRFARDSFGGQNIVIRLQDNDAVIVTDYVKNIHKDIFSYIAIEKNVKLGDILRKTKELLRLESDWTPKQRVELFGGIYNSIRSNNDNKTQTYPESILEEYDMIPCRRFVRDGISCETQIAYNVGFDRESDRIVFPWRNELGEIVAVKGRINQDDFPDDVPKYLYLYRNNVSKFLFNYYECYEHLYGSDIYVFESEKASMQLYTWGIKTAVSLGSHSLSQEQCKLLMQLQPKSITFMLDKNLDLSETMKNYDVLKNFLVMYDVPVRYWDWTVNNSLPEKSSPSDGTLEQFQSILKNEIKEINERTEEYEDDIRI